jgi:hypothetical protein
MYFLGFLDDFYKNKREIKYFKKKKKWHEVGVEPLTFQGQTKQLTNYASTQMCYENAQLI